MKWQRLISIVFLLHTSIAAADEWNCRNFDMEISCHSDKCALAKDFTPMDIYFNDLGNISICAYSGCWEGMAKISRLDNFKIINSKNLKFSTSNSAYPGNDFLLVFDTRDHIAMIKGAGYAMPVTCNVI